MVRYIGTSHKRAFQHPPPKHVTGKFRLRKESAWSVKKNLEGKNMSCENVFELVGRSVVVNVVEELCARVGK